MRVIRRCRSGGLRLGGSRGDGSRVGDRSRGRCLGTGVGAVGCASRLRGWARFTRRARALFLEGRIRSPRGLEDIRNASFVFGNVRKRIPKGEIHSRIRFTIASTATFSPSFFLSLKALQMCSKKNGTTQNVAQDAQQKRRKACVNKNTREI